MIKKSVFGTRSYGSKEGASSELWFVTQYRLFGILVYEKAIQERVAEHAPSLI